MTYIRITRIVLQTAAEWTASLQVLHTYEAGLESDTGKMKRGNGLDVYSALSYLPGFGAGGGGGDMLAANNLSDVADLQISRQNLFPSFTGNTGKFLKVNATEDDVEFAALAGGGDMLSSNNLSDVTNPVTALANLGITGTDISNWNAAFGWGNHASAGYLTAETDPIFTAWYNSGNPNLLSIQGSGGGIIDLTNVADIRFTVNAGDNIWLINGSGGPAAKLDMASLSVDRKFSFPDQAGTFALLSDLSSFITAETDPVFTAWLGTNDYLSSSTTSTQSGYFGSLRLKDAINPSHYLNITLEDDLTGNRNLQISVSDGNKLVVFTGNAVLSGTNTGDQTSIVGISGTKAQFDTACSDGNFLYVGDVTQYTDELAQDAVGAMVTDGTLVYVDATPLLTRGALTGAITAAQGSNTTALGSFTKSQLDTAVSDGNVLYVGDVLGVTDGDKGDVVVSSSGTVWNVESAAGAWAFKGEITPAQITSNQDDYNPTGFSSAYRLRIETDSSARSIRGISGGIAGRRILIDNIGTSFGFILPNEAVSSTDINRILTPNGITYSAGVGQSIELIYDGTLQRWKFFNSAGTANGTVITGIWPVLTIGGLQVTNTMLAGSIVESKLSITDNATGNVTSSAHGFAPKSPADSALYLNGAATPAFALPNNVQFLAITGDQTSTSTSLADVPGLASFSTVAGKTYYFCFELMVSTNATTVGILCTANHSTAVTSINAISWVPISATAWFSERISALDGGTLQTAGPGATVMPYRISGNFVANTAGTFALRYRSETGAAAVVKAGSYGYITRIS